MRVNGGRRSGDHHGRPKPPQIAVEPGLGHADFGLCQELGFGLSKATDEGFGFISWAAH